MADRLTFTRARVRLIAVTAAVGLIAAATAGCGGGVPSGAVAKVDDDVIKKSLFDHWLGAAARSQQPPGSSAPATPPDPPSFTKCAAAKGRQPVPKGAKKPTQKQLRDQCKQEYESLKGQVMQFLISATWIQQEAKRLKVDATEQQVRKSFEDQKKQSFPKERDYKKFLESSGMTEADLLFRVRLDVLSNKVREKVISGKGNVPEDEISDYYNENKERFAQPERRDLRVILTKTGSKAQAAKKALDSGRSWKDVAKEFSIDEASKSQGGKLPGVAKGQQEKAFDDAIFKAPKGQLVGPVRTQFGHYVFEVTKITPAQQQTLQQAHDSIKNLLVSQRQQKALDDFVKEFRANYRDKTICAGGFKIQDCKNGPSATGTGPASGSAPQSSAPSQNVAPTPGAPTGAPPVTVPPTGGGAAPPTGAPPTGAPPPPPPPPSG